MVVRGCDPHHPLPRRVGSVQRVRVFPADRPAGWSPWPVEGGHSYLVSRSCEFSSSRFPTSLPIPETKGMELSHVPGEARP